MPVELHIVSDSTGETAARLGHALEAQFPEQEFEGVRHPRGEAVADPQTTRAAPIAATPTSMRKHAWPMESRFPAIRKNNQKSG